MTECIALIRGINVGRAKRIAMADLRALLVDLGHQNVRTLVSRRSLLEESWAPDALAVGSRAAYLWCANGVLASKLVQVVAHRSGETVTTRNWGTVLKLLAASNAGA